MAIIINARREGYGTDQIERTLTVGELVEILSGYDPDAPVMVGNDPQSYGWYTYGGIRSYDISEHENEDEDDYENE